jgi:release factor glutamine methyltransferase
VTVLEVIQRSATFLARKEVESPRLQAELLLAHVLGLPRLRLYLDFERVLTEPDLERMRLLVQRRGAREPLQYLVGTTSFCGREFRLTPAVLIPRPETEQLAEHAGQFLASLGDQPATVLDFGTGSGCLAISLALRAPHAVVHALDVSLPALEVARQNAAVHGVSERIHFHAGDGLPALPAGLHFQLVVANPPYIPTAEIATLAPEVRDHEPLTALDGGPDGLDFIRRLAAETPQHLAPGGRLWLEFGDGQAGPARSLFEEDGWQVNDVLPDLAQRPRFLTAVRKAHPA